MRFRFQSVLTFTALLTLSFAAPTCTLAQTTTRLSLGADSVQGNNDSFGPKISADGRFVVFSSYATNFVAADTNNQLDLFQRELATGITKRINVATDGTQVAGLILGYATSSNGRYITFSTDAAGLVTGDSNGFYDVFLRDTVNNTTTRISNGINNASTDGDSVFPTISSDGRYIAYESLATNLVAGDTNGIRDVFVYDRSAATTTLLSRSSAGTLSDAQSYNAVISGDGSTVAFYSNGSNLIAGDTNEVGDVFVRNIAASTTGIVSISTGGTLGNGVSGTDDISLSNDGKMIAFDSGATNLVAGDTNARIDVFVRDLTVPTAPTTTRVSVSTAGIQGNGSSFLDAITPDGKFIVFDSEATNLVTGDTNATFDVFLYNRQTATTTRVSLGGGNVEGNAESSFADIAADGNSVVFASYATTLVPNDTNASVDIFLRTLDQSGASLSGRLNLEGIAPTAPNQTLTFTFRAGSVTTIKTVAVSPSGAFTIMGLPRANYNVLISGGNYLSKLVRVDLSAGSVNLSAPILLKAGDGTRDNAVDTADLSLLIMAYNKTSPGRDYDPRVDLNLDGANDILDLILLVNNYNLMGDILP